jgi:hypothetical protein
MLALLACLAIGFVLGAYATLVTTRVWLAGILGAAVVAAPCALAGWLETRETDRAAFALILAIVGPLLVLPGAWVGALVSVARSHGRLTARGAEES